MSLCFAEQNKPQDKITLRIASVKDFFACVFQMFFTIFVSHSRTSLCLPRRPLRCSCGAASVVGSRRIDTSRSGTRAFVSGAVRQTSSHRTDVDGARRWRRLVRSDEGGDHRRVARDRLAFWRTQSSRTCGAPELSGPRPPSLWRDSLGKLERPIGYVRTNFSYGSGACLNRTAARWRSTTNSRGRARVRGWQPARCHRGHARLLKMPGAFEAVDPVPLTDLSTSLDQLQAAGQLSRRLAVRTHASPSATWSVPRDLHGSVVLHEPNRRAE